MEWVIAYAFGYIVNVIIVSRVVSYDDTMLSKGEFAVSIALFWPVLWLMAIIYMLIIKPLLKLAELAGANDTP